MTKKDDNPLPGRDRRPYDPPRVTWDEPVEIGMLQGVCGKADPGGGCDSGEASS